MKKDITRLLLILVCCAALIAGCIVPSEKARERADLVEPAECMKSVSSWAAPTFEDDLPFESLITAVEASFEYYRRLDPASKIQFGGTAFSVQEMKDFLKDFVNTMAATTPGSSRQNELVSKFDIYQGGYGREGVLFTGYYIPVLYGSRLPGIDYTVPLYSLPRDVITVDLGRFKETLKGMQIVGRYQSGGLVPYYSRQEIDRQGILNGRGCEIVWIKDSIDAFFMHIQGSARIVLPDKTMLFLHYAGSNGRPYQSIGKLLIEEGKISPEEMSMQSLRKYLKENPQEMERILDHNQSYVFFESTSGGLPVGSLNVPITAGRTIAADHAYYPPGAIAYIETQRPILGHGDSLMGWESLRRFVLVQDRGGAIRGPNRADLFWGEGDEAGSQAGWMNRTGNIYFLSPRKSLGVQEGLSKLSGGDRL